MYTVEAVIKGSIVRVVSQHPNATEARRALGKVEGMGVVRNSTGRVTQTNLARTTGVLR
jgi:hypothetical protein